MPHTLQTRISTALWDALMERSRSSGQSVGHIVQAALAEALSAPRDVVVAAAGGCVLSPANRALLSKSEVRVLWLDADVPALAERTSRSAHRPLLDGDASERGRLHHPA